MKRENLLIGMMAACLAMASLTGCQGGGATPASSTAASVPATSAASSTASNNVAQGVNEDNILEKIVQVNADKQYLLNHSTVTMTETIYPKEGEFERKVYIDDSKVISKDSYLNEYVVLKDSPLVKFKIGGSGQVTYHYYLDDAHEEILEDITFRITPFAFNPNEKVESLQPDGDFFEVTTMLAAEYLKDNYAKNLGYDQKGLKGLKTTMLVDRETLEIERLNGYLVYEDEEIKVGFTNLQYDLEKEPLDSEFEKKMKNPSIKLKFVEVGGKEVTYESEVLTEFNIHIPSKYEEKAYMDKECTQAYDRLFEDGDTIYIKLKG